MPSHALLMATMASACQSLAVVRQPNLSHRLPCSTSRFWALRPAAGRRCGLMVVNANSSDEDELLAAERRLEAIERARKRGKGSGDLNREMNYSAKAMAEAESDSAAAEWKEGELFPEGWEQMNPFEKFYNAYAGKRGLLFWANKFAYASVFILIGAWIVFRFIGPALGLYKVAD